MVVALTSGETLHGVIEWYDQRCIKLTRAGKPNLLIMKNAIRYLYKQQSGTPSKAESDQQPRDVKVRQRARYDNKGTRN